LSSPASPCTLKTAGCAQFKILRRRGLGAQKPAPTRNFICVQVATFKTGGVVENVACAWHKKSELPGRSSRQETLRCLNSLFEADRRRVVFEWGEVRHPIESGFAIERDRFRLFDSSFQSDGIIFKISGKPFEFFQDSLGDSVTPFAWHNKHSLNFCYFILH